MQKICVVILLSVLLSHYEALPQTKWSRPIRNNQNRSIRERRQFSFGEWVPLSQPCPTCRPFADPLDVGLRGENIGLTPPRPPTVTRQVHGEANFFRDESSILSVPPPPPSAIPRHPSGNFQFSSFGTQFNSPLPTQQIFPQTQQIQFLPQTFLPNQPVLVNNQQILSGLNQQQNNIFGQDQTKEQVNAGKVINFNNNFKAQKIPQNVVLEQNNGPIGQKQTFSNKPQPFTLQQQNQQQGFLQPQSIINPSQHSFAFGSSILAPPPTPNNTQNIVIPGLDKEEIQLLYIPVETLRQRGNFQQQQLINQQNIQYQNRPNSPQRQVNNRHPTEQTPTTQGKGHLVPQNKNNEGQTISPHQVTTPQPFSSTVSPSTAFFQHLPFQQTPQPFVSATPISPTIQPFSVTPSSTTPNFSPFTPETTLSQLSTLPNAIQFSPQDIGFGTTPNTILNQGAFQEEIVNEKSQFSAFKSTSLLNQEQSKPTQQTFAKSEETTSPKPQQTAFFQEQQREINGQNNFPQQIDQQQTYLQRQQGQQQLLQEQKEKERQLKFRQHKELEAQRLLQQRQKELEEERFLERQKKQKEQLLLQQQRQKELEQQRILIEQQKELEAQRRLQLQKQKELEEKRRLQQLKQREEEEKQRLIRIQQQQQKEEEEKQRLLRIQQQQQKEEEEKQRLLRIQQQQQREEQEKQRLLRIQQQQQREEQEKQKLLQKQLGQQRLLMQQKLQRQKEENILKQQQIQYLQHQQQQQQQQKQTLPQVFQETNRHVLPTNENLNLIPQVEKEIELENKQLIPHQPPLSVFYRGPTAAQSQIVDVLRELRSSKTIIVLDQYFEKIPKVFVGPAGLIPPNGYRKFELPYLSNLETNTIERRIDKLPFFVAPVNFVPPPGYAKILFPAPHVGSVVVSTESNPAIKLGPPTKENPVTSVEEDNDGSFPIVGPELPGLINGLETETTTIKPVTFASTPSLPQTTAQLRSKRPNNNVYKPQSRKPISRTRPQTTSKPEDVTQSFQRTETAKDSSEEIRKPFNRFLHRRRQQTTTESSLKNQNGKSLENRYYSVEVYHQEKNTNQLSRTQQKSDVLKNNDNEEYQNNEQLGQQTDRLDRTTSGGHGGFRLQPTPDYFRTQSTGSSAAPEVRGPENTDYSDASLQTFEDGPLPTGSAKTITQELYRPNSIRLPNGEVNFKSVVKPEETENFQSGSYEDVNKFLEPPVSNPTAAAEISSSSKQYSEEKFSIHSTPVSSFETQDVTPENVFSGEVSRTELPSTPNPNLSREQQSNGFLGANEEFTSAFAELSKHHQMTRPTDSPKSPHLKFPSAHPTPEVSVELGAPEYQETHFVDLGQSSEEKPVKSQNQLKKNIQLSSPSPNEPRLNEFDRNSKTDYTADVSDILSNPVSPTAPGATHVYYTTDYSVKSQIQNSENTNQQQKDQHIGSFINLDSIPSTPEFPQGQVQYFPSPTPSTFQVTVTENKKYPELSEEVTSTPDSAAGVTEVPSAQTYTSESVSTDLRNHESTQTPEVSAQNVVDGVSNDHELKLPNPSIVRVRTRGRNRSRGQVNFAASQSTTPAPYTRSKTEHKNNEYNEQELPRKTNHFRDYQPIKSIKTNQYRGLKKLIRTTTETATESEYKSNVYTIRPQRRPTNPSTVSTKRIRRPTTPLPSVESATEAFGLSTSEPYYQSEHSDFSPSGVSNDVYYEQSSLSPISQKFRKFTESAEQKSDVINVYGTTAYPSPVPTHLTLPTPTHISQGEIHEETKISRNPEGVTEVQEHSGKFPEWNPSESGFDVSGIVLTTIRVPSQEDQVEDEEPKKYQDSKKAFDPDLDKKNGRRRVRVRVHKRPHENFETAESQNLRTVANVLVPPTTTYKPNDQSSFHQLAKNADFSFGGQKLFGSRSREYFRKRLNLTFTEGGVNKKEENVQSVNSNENSESKVSGLVREGETQRNESETAQAETNDATEESKITRPKFKGFVRKIIKHGHPSKEESKSNESSENEDTELKHEKTGFHLRQQIRANHTGRFNGTRHKTLVRFVKKNKTKTHETESYQVSTSQEQQKEEPTATEPLPVNIPETPKTDSENINIEEEKETVQSTEEPKTQHTQRSDVVRSKESEQTEAPKIRRVQIRTTQAPKVEVLEGETYEVSSEKYEKPEDSTPQTLQPGTPLIPQTGLYLTQKPKFYQTVRPLYYRPPQSGIQRTKEYVPSTEQTVQDAHEKKDTPVRPKYGKTTGFGTYENGKQEENKRFNEQQQRNKNQHTQEVRKYLRTKSRDGVFSQFSKNKYFTSQKIEKEVTPKESLNKETEDFTTPLDTKSSLKDIEFSEEQPTEAAAARTDSTEADGETVNNISESEIRTTTETQENSSEEEESSEEEGVTNPIKYEETTTEFKTELPTTMHIFSEKSTIGETQTEKVETANFDSQPDIYRFSKSSFSFDETEKFTGTKNRAHVRNITTDIIENTATFSAPGLEKRPEISGVTHLIDEKLPTTTEFQTDITSNQKTEETTQEFNTMETTTDLLETSQTRAVDPVTKAKIAKVLKTSTTTKISHETEICYKGKCIRTKSENPDEDLKKLVDSASIMKIEKTKT